MSVESFNDRGLIENVSGTEDAGGFTVERTTAPVVANVLVAQAATDDLAPVDAGQSASPTPPANPAAGANPLVAADGNNQVQLPAGTSLDRAELRGNNMVLVQPDGSEIIIQNAASNVPTFVIDGVEIPQEALIAALNLAGIDVAAGPNGNLVAATGGPDGSGANFLLAVPGIGDADPILDLLPPTALLFGTEEERDLFVDVRPVSDVAINPLPLLVNEDQRLA
ncbi:MAG: hypothetical protein ACRCT6_01530, partial [Notoacmeibacter sp.]